jgi:hypothetical protein
MVWSVAAQRSCVITGCAVEIYSRNCEIIWGLVSDCTKKNIRLNSRIGTLLNKKYIDNVDTFARNSVVAN